MRLSAVELCAGAGGQSLGLERAGVEPLALVEIEPIACETLRQNRPQWNVLEANVKEFSGSIYRGADMVCAGVPCPPFSVASKQLGESDDRNLFPDALRIVSEVRPRAVMFENVPGLADKKFRSALDSIFRALFDMGYVPEARILNACDYGTPQLRPRLIIVGLDNHAARRFVWPAKTPCKETVGSVLRAEMASKGWRMVDRWAAKAATVAPTLVGGSKKHGGPDLGPTRARQAWAKLGVDGLGVADEPPSANFEGMPRLTVKMAAMIQGFPPDWRIAGRKTKAYRQVGNAFPPQVSHAVAAAIRQALTPGAKKSLASADRFVPISQELLVHV